MKKFSVSPSNMRLAKKYALWSCFGMVLFGTVCFFAIPPWIKNFATNEIGARIQRDVRIQKVSVNPYTLSFTFEGLEVGERKDESGGDGSGKGKGEASERLFMALDKLYLNVELTSLFRNGIVLNEIRLEKPRFAIVRLKDGRYNLSDLIENLSEVKDSEKNVEEKGTKRIEQRADEKKNEGSGMRRFSLSNIRVIDGKIDFDDRVQNTRNTIDEINLMLPFVSNIPRAVRIFDEPSFSARVDGSKIAFKGKSRLQIGSLESELAFDISDFELPKYLAYLPVEQPVRVKSGRLDGLLRVNFRQSDSTFILSGNVAIKELELAEALLGAPLASAKRLDVSIASADLLRRKIQVNAVSLDSPKIYLQTSPSGVLNWKELVSKKKAPSRKPDTPVEWSVDRTTISGGSLQWSNKRRSNSYAFTVDSLDMTLSSMDHLLASPVKVEAKFKLDGKSNVEISGKVVPSPLNVELKLDAGNVDLTAFQPSFTDKLNVILTSGHMKGSGLLSLRQPLDSPVNGYALVFSGDLFAEDLRASYKANKSSSLHLRSLRLKGIDFRQNPDALAVNEIELSDFTVRAILAPNEKFDLFGILARDKTTSAPTASPDEGVTPPSAKPPLRDGMSIRINRVGIEKGSVFFSDHLIKPNYSTNLRNISGTIDNLSSNVKTRARLALRGRYDNVVPFTVQARVNPFSSNPYLDLNGEIKGVEMTQFSGYSGKYAGHSIQKGKLSLSAQYQVEENQLTAENHIFIDQLNFGRAVESPDATPLPVTLLVSLLKNRNGEITVDLPVRGLTNDPQFSVGGLIFEAILNLLMKAVSSPFTLLASMFEGGEEISALEFDYGSAAIKPETQRRLETLSKIFYERPGLKADLRGLVDPKHDIEGLRKLLVDRSVRMAKHERMGGAQAKVIDAIEVSPEEYPDLLERVYRDEDFEKPRNFIGYAKTLPVEEMRRLLMENTRVGEEELRNLADRRARAARDWLIEHGVSDERLFLLPPRLGRSRGNGASSGSPEDGPIGEQGAAQESDRKGAKRMADAPEEKAKRSQVDITLK
jgi:uncharacterized protein involved in outer membrane biogenesis